MKKFKLFYLMCLFTLCGFSQSIYVKNNPFYNISSKEIQEVSLDSLVIDNKSTVFLNNTILKVNVLISENERPSVHLKNSLIIYRDYSDIVGELTGFVKPNKPFRYFYPNKQGHIVVTKGKNILFEGGYNFIKYLYISQGIYKVYLNGVLDEVIYFY